MIRANQILVASTKLKSRDIDKVGVGTSWHLKIDSLLLKMTVQLLGPKGIHLLSGRNIILRLYLPIVIDL